MNKVFAIDEKLTYEAFVVVLYKDHPYFLRPYDLRKMILGRVITFVFQVATGNSPRKQ
jgi:hypothetical protein